jgi:hypothetical protein
MRRTNWKTISTLVTMIVVLGCQENTVAPTQSAASAPAAMSLAPQHPNLVLSPSAAKNSGTVDFTVSTGGGVFMIGNNAVYFPANSICDPATSSYGVGTWDSPCKALRSSIKIHAVTRLVDGNPAVDFSPSLRFVPSNDPSRWVWIYMSSPNGVSISKTNILFAPVLGGPAYDEALTDPSVRTFYGAGVSVRHIKHFTGYLANGTWCEDGGLNNPPECSLNPPAP